MDDTISRRQAVDAICKEWCCHGHDDCENKNMMENGFDPCDGCSDVDAIMGLPFAQPEIIRCKDCKYYIPYEWMFDGLSKSSHIEDYSPDEIGCSVNDHNYPPDGYCSCAERRTDG